MNNTQYELIVGLEIHVELSTQSKMFCQCRADWFGLTPNTNVCPVCLGLPGALPVPNHQAIEKTLKLALALGSKINHFTKFDRKNYFYPDLPKGYQISQYDEPLALGGAVKVALFSIGQPDKSFSLTRIHLEEDTGKLSHQNDHTVVDFNRSGVPLMEIVTEPVFRSSEEVKLFLEELHTTIVSLGISDANMEKGSMRLEPNISLRPIGTSDFLPYKVEVKNINSFNFVKKAIDFEYKRQLEHLQKGLIPVQETRGFDEKSNQTISQRKKEGASDYRYFPEPDIPPIEISQSWLETITKTISPLPYDVFQQLTQNYQLKNNDAFILSRNSLLSDKFISICEKLKNNNLFSPQSVANLIINKKLDIDKTEDELIPLVLSSFQVKSFNDKELEILVEKTLLEYKELIIDYKNGKIGILMYIVGQIMKNHPNKFPALAIKEELLKQIK